MSELHHDTYYVPTYPTGSYTGLDTNAAKRRKKKNPIGFSQEDTVTPYTERRQAGYYDPDGPITQHADTGTTFDPDDRTKAELQDALAALGLPTTGNKPELAERLTQAQAAQ